MGVKHKRNSEQKEVSKSPPKRCTGLVSDSRAFFFHKPETPTLITFNSPEERENFSRRIAQRIGIDTGKYNVLNIHQIGIDVPVRYVFEELLHWDEDSTCWPNHIAEVVRQDGKLEHIQIYLMGKKKYPLGMKSFLGIKCIPLFKLDALTFLHMPQPLDYDNARYLLYECSGGYPIGFFALYVRSSIAEQNEKESSQLFMLVSFNFYGREDVSERHILNRIWKKVHNRVTSNVMNRVKQLCEWRFDKIQNGIEDVQNDN